MTEAHTVRSFPREIAPSIFWFGNCLPVTVAGERYHSHLGVYLLRGAERTLLVDTGMMRSWPSLSKQLDVALDGRTLDFVFPTHPEVPHASNLPNLLERFPDIKVVGDTRDYAVYYPELEQVLQPSVVGDRIDLGGLVFRFLPAVLRDLPSSMWGFEETSRVLFVADGFGFIHSGSADPFGDHPVHRPGECTLTTAELPGDVVAAQGEVVVRAALYWTRFVDSAPMFEDLKAMFAELSPMLVAPAHGNVVSAPEAALAVAERTHENAYRESIAAMS